MAITVRAARVNVGLTQKEAAEKLGISESMLYKIEVGESFPRVPLINKMLELYDTHYDDLIFLPEQNG